MIRVKCKSCGKTFLCNADGVMTFCGKIVKFKCFDEDDWGGIKIEKTTDRKCYCKECTIKRKLGDKMQIKWCYGERFVFR
jgi:hypothetical protein